MLFAFAFFSSSALLGIDFGGETLRVSTLAPGRPISMLLDRDSQRFFKSVLTVVPKGNSSITLINESVGNNFDFAFNQMHLMKKYPNSTLRYYMNNIGKVLSKQFFVNNYKRMLYPTTALYTNNRLVFCGVFPELLLIRSLKNINETLRAMSPPFKADTIYGCVPKFMMQQERNAIRTVARHMNYSIYLIDQSQALAYNYGFTHDKKIAKSKQPLRVAFFDLGETNLQITITEFSRNKNITSREIFYDYNETIGGRDFDIAIYNILKKIAPGSLSTSDQQSLINEANRIKLRLTLDKFVLGQTETSTAFGYNISRKAFEEEISPFLDEIAKMVSKCPKVDRVNLIGGSSRVPIVQEIIKKGFKVSELYTSMNPEEAISNGAAFVGASLSRDFRLAIHVNHSSINLYGYSIIDKNNKITKPDGSGQIMFVKATSNRIPPGSTPIAAWGSCTGNASFVQTKDGLWRIKYQTKKFHPLWKIALFKMYNLINARENYKLKLDSYINDLENIILDIKSTVRDSDLLNSICTEKEKNEIMFAANQTDKWFLKQKHPDISTLEFRISVIHDAFGTIMCRVQNVNKLNESQQRMNNTFQEIENTILSVWSVRSRRPKRQEIRNLLKIMLETKLWVEEKKRMQTKIGLNENPIFKWYDLEKRVKFIQEQYAEIKEKSMYNLQKKLKTSQEPIYATNTNINNNDL